MSQYLSGSPRPTWEVFLDFLRPELADGTTPGEHRIAATSDPPDPEFAAAQTAWRHAWMHARYALGLSVYESIRLSQRLLLAYADWRRTKDLSIEALRNALRASEAEARKIEPIRLRLAFVEAFEGCSRDRPDLSACDAALLAYDEAESRFGGPGTAATRAADRPIA